MSSLKFIIPVISILFFLGMCSCEDTKNTAPEKKKILKEKKQAEQEKRTDSILNSIKIPAGGKSKVDIAAIKTIEQEELIPFLTKYGKENPETKVFIETPFGDIKVQLYKDTPLHRANFIRLVKMGYFDATFFHRVSKNFVIQGGNSDRTAASKIRSKVGSFLIPSEFEAGHTHTRGAFGAAKYSEQNVSNASSPFEFYIVQGERGAHHIDNEHTVFGRVISGMDVVDKIAQVEVDDKEWPRENVDIDIKVLD